MLMFWDFLNFFYFVVFLVILIVLKSAHFFRSLKLEFIYKQFTLYLLLTKVQAKVWAEIII